MGYTPCISVAMGIQTVRDVTVMTAYYSHEVWPYFLYNVNPGTNYHNSLRNRNHYIITTVNVKPLSPAQIKNSLSSIARYPYRTKFTSVNFPNPIAPHLTALGQRCKGTRQNDQRINKVFNDPSKEPWEKCYIQLLIPTWASDSYDSGRVLHNKLSRFLLHPLRSSFMNICSEKDYNQCSWQSVVNSYGILHISRTFLK
jgi:hypothetical protein